jgi:hypothetical protein
MIKYILFNEDNTEVINTILCDYELDNATFDVTRLVKLQSTEHWDQTTSTIETSIRLTTAVATSDTPR